MPSKEDEVRGAPSLRLLQVADDGQRLRGEGAQARPSLEGVGAARQPVLQAKPGLRTAQVHTPQLRVAWQHPDSVGALPPLGGGGNHGETCRLGKPDVQRRDGPESREAAGSAAEGADVRPSPAPEAGHPVRGESRSAESAAAAKAALRE